MAGNPNFQKQHGHHLSPSKAPYLYALGIIIIIAAVYFLATRSELTVNQLNSMQVFTLPLNGSASFALPNDNNVYSIYLKAATNSSATFYVSGVPILIKPIFLVQMHVLANENLSTVNTNTANLHLELRSTTNGQATVALTPLPASLNAAVTPGVTIINPARLLQGNTLLESETTTGGAPIVTTITTTITTTTSTTTIYNGVTNGTTSQVMTLINNTQLGTLMKNLVPIYAKSNQCTADVYNTTYSSKYGSLPNGPNSYYNVSPYAPRSLRWTISNFSVNVYNVTYIIAAQQSIAAGAVLLIQMNTASGLALPPTPKFIGPWTSLNYSLLNAQYAFASGISNNCAAVVPYIPGH